MYPIYFKSVHADVSAPLRSPSYALCPVLSALPPPPYAPCPPHCALCPMRHALCPILPTSEFRLRPILPTSEFRLPPSAFCLTFSPSQLLTFSFFHLPHSHFRILSHLLTFSSSLFSAFRIPTSKFFLTFSPSQLLIFSLFHLPHSDFRILLTSRQQGVYFAGYLVVFVKAQLDRLSGTYRRTNAAPVAQGLVDFDDALFGIEGRHAEGT